MKKEIEEHVTENTKEHVVDIFFGYYNMLLEGDLSEESRKDRMMAATLLTIADYLDDLSMTVADRP